MRAKLFHCNVIKRFMKRDEVTQAIDSYHYILGDLALFDPGLDPLDPGLEPFLDADGDLDPDLEPFLELGGVGLRLLVPFLEAVGEGERSFLLFLDFGEPCNMKDGNVG